MKLYFLSLIAEQDIDENNFLYYSRKYERRDKPA